MILKTIISAISILLVVAACTSNMATSNSRSAEGSTSSDRRAIPTPYPAGDGALVDLGGRLIVPGGAK